MSASQSWVSWVIQCEVQASNRDKLVSLSEEMSSDFLANEPGTLNFEWSVDSAFGELHLHERYAILQLLLVIFRPLGPNMQSVFWLQQLLNL